MKKSTASTFLSSLIYKDTNTNLTHDVVSNLTHERVQQILSCPGVDSMFVKVALTLLPDTRLTPTEKWVLIAIKFLIWFYDGKCKESKEVIACLAGLSGVTTKRAIKELVKEGWLICERNPNPAIPDVLFEPPVSKLRLLNTRPKCQSCGRYAPLGKSDACVICRKQARADEEVRAFMERHSDCSYEVAWAKLTAHGSKAGPAALKVAYFNATGIMPTDAD